MIASERPAELNATAQNPWHVYRVTTMIKQKARIKLDSVMGRNFRFPNCLHR